MFEGQLRGCLTDALMFMATRTRTGFSRNEEDGLVSQLETLKSQIAIAKSSGHRFDAPIEELADQFDQSIQNWLDVSGENLDAQKSRRLILGGLRDWYVNWCIHRTESQLKYENEKAESTTKEIEVDDLHLSQDEAVRHKFSQIVTACSLRDIPGVYVLGCFDLKKTVHVQQRRAVALVNALIEFREISPTKKIAVIGGGFGGLSAAMSAFTVGASVKVFERQSTLLPLQIRNTQRFLHPNFFDWPQNGSEDPNTRLPFLNWTADVASSVADRVLQEFQSAQNTSNENGGSMEIELNTEISDIEAALVPGRSEKVKISSRDSRVNEFFDIVFVAVGFGTERERESAEGIRNYWDNDSLCQPTGFSADNPERVLISGTGDGALIDAVRASLSCFDHASQASMLNSMLTESSIEELAQIEREAQNFSVSCPNIPFDFFGKYRNLFGDGFFSDEFGGKCYSERSVFLNHRTPEVFSLGSALSNRILVYALIDADVITLRRGNIYPKSLVRDEDGLFQIRWREGDSPESFHQVVVRHGTDLEYLRSNLPNVWEAAKGTTSVLRGLDLTSLLDNELLF